MLVEVGSRTEGGGTARADIWSLAAMHAGVLCEPRCHAEAFTAHPARERSLATMNALVILQVWKLTETLPTDSALKGSFIGVRSQVNRECGRVGEFLSTELAGEPAWNAFLAQRATAMRHKVFPQCRAGGEASSAGCERAPQRRLTSVGEPVQVKTILSDTAVAAHITLQLTPHLPSSLTFIPAAHHGLPCAALQVRFQHCLIQELSAAVWTRLWFFIFVDEIMEVQLLAAFKCLPARFARKGMAGV